MKKTLFVIGAAAVLLAVMVRVESVAQELASEPAAVPRGAADSQALFAMGEKLFKEGRYAEAKEILWDKYFASGQPIALCEVNEHHFYYLGEIAFQEGNYRQASHWFLQSFSMFPQGGSARESVFGMAKAHGALLEQEQQNAIEHINRIIEERDAILGAHERMGVSPPLGVNLLAQNRGANAAPLVHTPNEPVLWRGPIPVTRARPLVENAQEVLREINSAIREHFPDLDSHGPAGSNDAKLIILRFNQATSQEMVDSVAQFVRDLPGVNEVRTIRTPSPPAGVDFFNYRNYLLNTPVVSDEQALALFRHAEYWYNVGNRFNAKPLFVRFVEQRPHDALLEHVLYYLGMIGWYCHTANGMHEAVHYFRQAVRMFPRGARFQESQDMLNHAKAWLRLREMVGQVLNHEKAVVELAIIIQNVLPDVEVSASYTSRVLSVEIDTPLSQEQREKIDEIVRDFSFYRVNVIGVKACADRVSIQIELPSQERTGVSPPVDATQLAQNRGADTCLVCLWSVGAPPTPHRPIGMQPVPAYIIEPPDILNVRVVNVIPKTPYLLRVFDVVEVIVLGTPATDPIAGLFPIEPGGNIELGSIYGSVKIEGFSTEQARDAIRKHLTGGENGMPILRDPLVAVRLARMSDMEQIDGTHAVGPDGFITLGSYGRVRVNGLTVQEAKEAIEKHLSPFLDKPQVVVEVFAMNSKRYYVIMRWTNLSEQAVYAFPWTGNDTVMSALAELRLMNTRLHDIKHIRPGNDEPTITPLCWDRVLTSRSGTGDNVQLLPDDRLVLLTTAEE